MFLLDTNVISAARSKDRAGPKLSSWLASAPEEALYVSVLTLMELRRGALMVSAKDPGFSTKLERWIDALKAQLGSRLLPIDAEAAEAFARMSMTRTLPFVDGFLAATASTRGLTLVTMNTRDVADLGVPLLDPSA